MNLPTLFPMPEAFRRRNFERAQVETLKKEFTIFTHRHPDTGRWLAFSVPECSVALAAIDCALDGDRDVRKPTIEPVEILARYCRILDEAGLIEDGHKTERTAVLAVVERIRNKSAKAKP